MFSKFSKLLLVTGLVLVVFALSYASLASSMAGSERAYTGDNIWTWAGVNGNVRQIVTSPLNPDTVYAYVEYGAIMKSTDGGGTWSNIAQPDWAPQTRKLAMADNAPNVLYASADDAVYRTTDSGTTWQLVKAVYDPYGIAVSPVDWREVYISSSPFNSWNTIISKTMDGGETWTTVGVFDRHDSIFDENELTIAPSAPHILLYAVERQYLYKTTDAGQSWSQLGIGFWVESLAFDPKNSNTIYAGSNILGGWKSTDGGGSWQPLANGLQPIASGFAIDPDNTQVIHAADGSAGVLESIDGGASWASMNAGIQGLSVRSIAVASRNPLIIYAGLAGGGIWKMTRTDLQDFGITINDAALFTNQTAVTLTLTAPTSMTQMLISNDGGFAGANWEPFAASKPWTITAYGSYPIPRTVYAKFRTSGQTSGQYQDDIILDRISPTGTLQITAAVSGSVAARLSPPVIDLPTDAMTNTMYLPIVAKNYRPGFKVVGLKLAAVDDVSGVDSMLVSNDVSFVDAQWQAYTPALNWYVPDNGTTTVYVKYRDRAGNESPVYSAVTPSP